MTKETYYKKIAAHYDREADLYDTRLQHNKTLEKIRHDFRRVALNYLKGKNILDFGCGSGSDICFFATKYPDKIFTGLDLSEEMIQQTHKKVKQQKLSNVNLKIGTITDLSEETFDFIYVFFGALNTVHDLDEIVDQLHKHLNNRGKILVTFVNKWYPIGMLAYLRRLKFKKAVARLKAVWWGYSEKNLLKSKTYYGRDILKKFNKFSVLYKRGYSIVYPAWFQDRITRKLGPVAESLWRIDNMLSKTPLWSWGEYVLLVFEKK